MAKYLITVNDFGRNNAGPKAKADIIHFLAPMGYQSLVISPYPNQQVLELPRLNQLLNSLTDQDELMIQYPTYSPWIEAKLFSVHKKRQVTIYEFVHDVEALRMMKDLPGTVAREVKQFNKTDGIIVHNDQMKAWLKKQGVTVPMVSLGIFDYDNPQPVHTESSYQPSVVFAGNLRKARFLTKLHLQTSRLTVFGPSEAIAYPNGVTYAGKFSPAELPAHLSQCLGLVWDGSDVTTCDGRYGSYLRYNDPHKASLYLSSGLPVMVWDQSALASFVTSHHVGITIDNLGRLDQTLAAIKPLEYKLLRANAVKLAQKLRKGYFSQRAVRRLTEL